MFQAPPPALDAHINLLPEVINHSFALIMWDRPTKCCSQSHFDCLWAILIDSDLEKNLQMEVKGVQIRGMGSPVIVTSSADYSVMEACFEPREQRVTFEQLGVAPSCCSH